MLAATFLTGAILLLPKGGSCDYPPDAARVYKVQNAVILGQCYPTGGMNTGDAQEQREFLIQYLPEVMTSEGFRTTTSPFDRKTAIFARIAATETYDSSNLHLPTTDARHYTKLRDDKSEVLLSVSNTGAGYALTASHHYWLNGVEQTDYIHGDLLPSDFSSPTVLELDTRVNNNDAFKVLGNIRIEVCARRGLGSCHYFEFLNRFGVTAAPEFYLGSALTGLDSPVRYCHLPAFGTTAGSGYTSVCPGPGVPLSNAGL